jgi:putative PIG3 family NAD(P)H quinone oxidoreductase
MKLGDAAPPALVTNSVRIHVVAAGVNRADLLQRRGFYPPPPGASPILGLECAGEVMEVAEGVTQWKPGDRVMSLLAGGGYAEQVVVDAGSVMRVPPGISLLDAAALPEVFLTVFLNVFSLGGLGQGGLVLVHGGGSGIGTAAIQLARAAGARCVVTAGSDEKCQRCLDLGADVAVNYRTGDFVEAVREASGGEGAQVVLDSIGAPYLTRNLDCLAPEGRLVLIGLMGGAKAEIDLGAILIRRLQLIGSTLRTRSDAQKAAIVEAFDSRFGQDLNEGRLWPVVDRVLDLQAAPEAHRVMQASEHFGKIVLRVP